MTEEGRVHVAEFHSKCAACGDDIDEGDEIVLDPDDDWIHVDCEEES